MSIIETIVSSLKNIVSNKMRSILTMLGIIIGIAAVIAITSLGEGSSREMQDTFDEMGIGSLTVLNSSEATQRDRLTMEDVDVLKEHADVSYISALASGSAQLKLMDPKETNTAAITGVMSGYANIVKPTMLYGRYINDVDVDLARKVIVINDSTAEKVFGFSGQDILGRQISLRTWRGTGNYTIVGITENKNAALELQYNSPDSVIMPISTLQNLTTDKNLSSIVVFVNDKSALDRVATELTTMLDAFHNTTEKYSVNNIMNFVEQVEQMMAMITGFITAVAGISLFVGGIGVMNIMLVTVTERTREIGIRKSIGAKNKDILLQFLIEAMTITLIGGILGLALGIGGGQLIGMFTGSQAILSMESTIVSIVISSGIGLIFGVYPARKASKLDPIEALRYE